MNRTKKTPAPAATRDTSRAGVTRDGDMEQFPDEELGRLYGRGSPVEAKQALGQLLSRHSAQLRADAFRLSGGNPADADDLFGVFSLHLLEKHNLFDPDLGCWFAWARRVLSGCASGERRKRRTRQKYVPSNSPMVELAQSNNSPSWIALLKDEVAQAFQDCLSELDIELHQVFILRVYVGWTLADTSRQLDLRGGRGAAKKRTDETIKHIKNCMKGKGFGPDDIHRTTTLS